MALTDANIRYLNTLDIEDIAEFVGEFVGESELSDLRAKLDALVEDIESFHETEHDLYPIETCPHPMCDTFTLRRRGA